MTAAVTAVAASLSVACVKTKVEVRPPEGMANLTVTVANGGTKASGENPVTNEDKINSVQVFVFASDGKLEAEAYGTQPSIDLGCTMGSKTVAVLCNSGRLDAIASAADLNSKVTSLTDNSSSSFIMFNSVPFAVDATAKSLTVTVKRTVSKIVLENISNKMTLEQYRSEAIKIKGIYLINVAGDTSMDLAAAPSLWLNRGSKEAAENSLYSEIPASLDIAYNSSDVSRHYFYCYPNPVEADSAAEIWSPRHTRLVVEAEVGGKTGYYPVTLPVLKANTVYTIKNLEITRPGIDAPDVVSALGTMTFTIAVADWDREDVSDITI